MRAVNLLPKDAERARRTAPNPVLLVGVAGLAVVLAAVFSMYMSANAKVQNLKDERAQAALNYALLKQHNPPPKVLPIQQELASLQNERISAVSSALSYQIPWSDILGQIALVMPSGVKLTMLAATTPVTANTQFATSATGTASASNLSLTGWAYSQESVILLLTRLKVLPPLSEVALISSTINSGASPVTYNFSISAQIQAPGATP